MATTTMGTTSPEPQTDRSTIYWGIAIAIVLALAVILTVRATSTRDMLIAPQSPTGTSYTAPVETAPMNRQMQGTPSTQAPIENNAATYNDTTVNKNGQAEPARTDVPPATIPTDSTQPTSP
jgi:hypothetical protein